MKVLNQAIAVRKGVQGRVHEKTTEYHRILEKPGLFHGFAKKFRPLEEAGERFPDETQKAQYNAEDIIRNTARTLTELFDIEATVDATNAAARADVKVDGVVVATSVPATTLIFLEKQLDLFRSDLKKAPELDQAEDWQVDPNSNLFKTKEQLTHKTKKVQRAIVKYEATKEHPAQTEMITEDVTTGHWELVKISGALPKPRKEELLNKTNKLIDAVKVAREEANNQAVVEQKVGTQLFDFLLNSK